jgi:hypothetical protein
MFVCVVRRSAVHPRVFPRMKITRLGIANATASARGARVCRDGAAHVSGCCRASGICAAASVRGARSCNLHKQVCRKVEVTKQAGHLRELNQIELEGVAGRTTSVSGVWSSGCRGLASSAGVGQLLVGGLGLLKLANLMPSKMSVKACGHSIWKLMNEPST